MNKQSLLLLVTTNLNMQERCHNNNKSGGDSARAEFENIVLKTLKVQEIPSSE